MKTNVLLFLFSLVFFACQEENKPIESRVTTLPYYQDASFTPYWLEPGSDSLDTFHKIPNFNLVNQDGEVITEKDVANKIYVADFFFTSCPGICPKMTENMVVLQKAFLNDNEIILLSHSVTPVKDSVSVLKMYANAKHVKSGKWHLLTGDRNQIYTLGRASYFVEEDLGETKTSDDFLHTENFILIDKDRHIRGIYNGLNKTSINQLIADIKTLKKS
jgi:protein SCO1/2